MIAGWLIRLSTPPRLSASANNSHRSSMRRAFSQASLDLYADDAATQTVHLAHGQFMLRMVCQSGIDDIANPRMLLQPLSDLQGVIAMGFHPQRQGFQALSMRENCQTDPVLRR